jgi:hypothetical protein
MPEVAVEEDVGTGTLDRSICIISCHKAPAMLCRAQQWVDEICAAPDIQPDHSSWTILPASLISRWMLSIRRDNDTGPDCITVHVDLNILSSLIVCQAHLQALVLACNETYHGGLQWHTKGMLNTSTSAGLPSSVVVCQAGI